MINLTHQNHCGILPATSLNNNQYKLDPGWTMIGTQPAPWKAPPEAQHSY